MLSVDPVPFYGRYDTQLPLSELAPFKEDLVVYDNDFDTDWSCVRENARGPDGHHVHFQLQKLSGMSRSQWHSMAQRASALPTQIGGLHPLGPRANDAPRAAPPPLTPSAPPLCAL